MFYRGPLQLSLVMQKTMASIQFGDFRFQFVETVKSTCPSAYRGCVFGHSADGALQQDYVNILLYLPQAVCQMVLLRAMLCEEYSANSHTLQFTPPDRFRFKGLAHRRMKNQLFKSYSSMYLVVLLRFEQILGCHGYIACLDVFTHMTII